MAKKFVHLHVHTEYSLLDGLSKIDKLLSHVKEHEMDAVAITDHGVMYGVIEFYKKCVKEGVKPLLGMEAYMTNIDHRERPEASKIQNFHLLLLAKNKEGYENLMKLTSIAHTEGFYRRPRFDRPTLAKYAKGLICTSACVLGEVPKALAADNYAEAKKTAEWFAEVFGKDYYLEVQRHEFAKYLKEAKDPEIKKELSEQQETEIKVNKGMVKLSRDLGVPIVATNDAHYVAAEDAHAQDALVCVATGKNVSDIKRLRFIDTPTFYIRPPEEMAALFSDLPEALENTVKVGEKCEIALTLDKWFFPKYEVTEGKSAEDELTKRARAGLAELFDKDDNEAKERLEYELKTINEKGYATYFLIVADMARWASEQGIVTNTRGSAAGSLVSYCLGITSINPLKYELPFERFLTPWRPSPPDIDFDIADDRREEVIEYLVGKYGSDKVAQICTFGRMLSRASVRDVARVLGYPYATGDKIAKLIPPPMQGFPVTIEKALAEVPELAALYKSDKDAKIVLDLARQVEGSARHVSVHAAGVVMAPTAITDFTPIQLDPEGKKIITQYDMDALDPNVSPGEAVGLLKFDLLGLRNLSILGAAIKIVKESRGVEIDLLKIPLNDAKTFAMLSRGETMGVFQLAGGGMTKYLKELKPTRVEDLMAMVALYRPGAMAYIPEYISRKNDGGKVEYFDPRMKEYMGKSYGLMVYQEDVLFSAINLAGYTWEEADKFRKAVGKKIPAEMAKQHDKFVEGCVKNGMEEKKAEKLFDMIKAFAAYGFGKAHAASYGMVAYQTAYMKANYPVEFMAALMTAESGDTEKVSQAVNECRRMKIEVLPPDINESEIDFKIVGKSIRFGFSAIKNVGTAAITAILEARSGGKFLSLSDFISRVDGRRVNKKVLESLVKVGALSQFGARAAVLAAIDEIRSRVKPKKGGGGQQGLFVEEEVSVEASIETLVSGVNEFSEAELATLERQLLGFSLTSKPLSEVLAGLSSFATHATSEVTGELVGTEMIKVAGVVSEVRVVTTKKSGQEMAFAKIEDSNGRLDVVIFPKLFSLTRSVWSEGTPVLVAGRVDQREDTPSLLAESVETQGSLDASKSSLFVKVPRDIDRSRLATLKKILLMYPGSQNVALVFEGRSTDPISLPFGISWSETLSRLISDCLEGKIQDSYGS